jgi:hypothetical protein
MNADCVQVETCLRASIMSALSQIQTQATAA